MQQASTFGTTRVSRAARHGLAGAAGQVLILLPGLALLGSALAKLLGVPAVTRQMGALGFSGATLTAIACLELVSATLFLWRPTRSFGLLLISAFLGGAICAHVQAGEIARAAGPAAFLALAWTGAALRHPQVHWSLAQ